MLYFYYHRICLSVDCYEKVSLILLLNLHTMFLKTHNYYNIISNNYYYYDTAYLPRLQCVLLAIIGNW